MLQRKTHYVGILDKWCACAPTDGICGCPASLNSAWEVESHTDSHRLPLGGGVSFALRRSEEIPSYFPPYFSRKEKVWRSLLSHSSNPKVIQIHLPLCQWAMFKVGCVATPAALTSLCPFMLLGITVTSQWSCFMGDPWMSVPTDERKSRIVLLDLPLFPSSSLKYTPGTFSLHNTINLSPHKGGALSYSDNSWLGTLFVPTLHCQV